MLGSSLDYEETLQRVARLAVPRLADWCAVELPDERGELEQVALAHVDPALVETARALRERYPPRPGRARSALRGAAHGRGAAARARSPTSCSRRSCTDAEQLAAVRELGLRSAMIVPMIARRPDARRDDVRLLRERAPLHASATSRSRRSSPRARRPRSRTRACTPSARRSRGRCRPACCPSELPRRAGLALRRRLPAGQRGAEVGGDFYDVVPGRGRAHGAARRRDRQGRARPRR